VKRMQKEEKLDRPGGVLEGVGRGNRSKKFGDKETLLRKVCNKEKLKGLKNKKAWGGKSNAVGGRNL